MLAGEQNGKTRKLTVNIHFLLDSVSGQTRASKRHWHTIATTQSQSGAAGSATRERRGETDAVLKIPPQRCQGPCAMPAKTVVQQDNC
jgi:hypothetical protein